MEKYLFPCAYKSFFGIDCPFCGFQRSFLLLIKGQLFDSFKMYAPLLPVLFLIMISIVYLINKEMINKRFLRSASLMVFIIVAVNYFIKLII